MSTATTIGGFVLLGLFLWMVVSIGACAGCDREYLGIDEVDQ